MAQKKGMPQYGAYIGIALLIIMVVMFVVRDWGPGGLPYYCKVFKMLAQGQQQVARNIDWENLQAMGTDVGGTYSKFKTKEAQGAYIQTFIHQLTAAFQSVGGRYEKFGNWRVQKQDASSAIVAGDYSVNKKTILLTYTLVDGTWKLSGIQWSGDEATQEK